MSDCITPYFMRHGRSVADDENVHGGRYDDALTAVRGRSGLHLVVAHGGILNAVMRVIVGAAPVLNSKHGIGFHFGDAGYVRTHYYPAEHYWAVAEIVPHLPAGAADE